MTPDSARLEALELWRRFNGARANTMPVDVAGIAAMVGLRVRTIVRKPTHALTHEQELSGVLDFATGTILLAGWESPARLRYTIAHEIGHEVLDHEERIGAGSETDQLEDEADAFASELLMPDDLVRSAIEQHGIAVPVLAEAFCVSVRAMERRLGAWLPDVSEVEWPG